MTRIFNGIIVSDPETYQYLTSIGDFILALPEFETLKRLVIDSEDDVAKAVGGNKAAGTRARKKMQDIKAAAQVVRIKILEGRGGEGDAGGDAADDSSSE